MTRRNDAPVATMGWGLPKPMTMRERLVNVMASSTDDMEDGNYQDVLDRLLGEMMKPSIDVYSVGGDVFHQKQALDPQPRAFGSMDHALAIWKAMIHAIKEGK